MTMSDRRDLEGWEVATGVILAAVWLTFKLYVREPVKERYGFFSWPYLGVDVISLLVLLAIGAGIIWAGRRVRASRGR